MYFKSESVILINVRIEMQQVTSPRLLVFKLFYHEPFLYLERTDPAAKNREESDKVFFSGLR